MVASSIHPEGCSSGRFGHVAELAIVGAGYGGTQTLAELVRQATGPLRIHLIESRRALSLGVAYSTTDGSHLLNVRAAKMGAFADDIGGFYDWLLTDAGQAAVARYCPTLEVTPDGFLPRAVYGVYLQARHQATLTAAQGKGIVVVTHHATAVDAQWLGADQQRLVVTLRSEHGPSELAVDALVLATGNLPPRQLDGVAALGDSSSRFVADLWNPPPQSLFPQQVSSLPQDKDVVIIGTGLTMVDAVLSLVSHGYRGRVTAISRHGLLPQDHAEDRCYPDGSMACCPSEAPQSARGLLSGLRKEVERAAARGFPWQSVVDALRTQTQVLWQRLPLTEQRRFFQRLAPFWSVHRHRVAPRASQTVQGLIAQGRLRVVAGHLQQVAERPDGLLVRYRMRGSREGATCSAALVLNCTGPDYRIERGPNPLLLSLLRRGLVVPCPLGMGLAQTPDGAVQGEASSCLFTLGFLRTGALLESTAVPELRQQAAQVAQSVLARLARLSRSEAGRAERWPRLSSALP